MRNIDIGLLILRIVVGVNLFVKHGLFKIPLLLAANPQFPDPFHLGVKPTLAFAFLSDGICSILMVLGLGTRYAAAIMAINLTVAWGMVYGFSIRPANGELLTLFLAGVVAVGLMGPGRYALDGRLRKGRKR